MVDLLECRADGDEDGEVVALYCEGWVDKTEFRNACTEWLADFGYSPSMATQQWFRDCPNSQLDPRRPWLLAAPEPEHIEHLRWRLVPACTYEDGRRCAPDCDCPLLFHRCKPRGPGRRYTVWDLQAARSRNYRAQQEANRGNPWPRRPQ